MFLNRILQRFGMQLVRANERLFRGDSYQRINQRRMEHLSTLGLPIAGQRVLELGAGIGDLSGFFLDRGCEMVITDARAENVNYLRRRHPGVRIELLDVEQSQAVQGGPFDIVFAYGLLYHLADPSAALRYMASQCSRFTLIETCVFHGSDASINPITEQALMATESIHGRGCRPTRRWIWETLRAHFPHVYVPASQPSHPEFPTLWQQPDGTLPPTTDSPLRAIFVAAHQPLLLPSLRNQLD